MKELNELVALAERADSLCYLMQNVNPHHILAIDEAFQALQHRAEAADVEKAGAEERCRMMFDSKNHWAERARAAEAKLAELENQPPVSMRYRWAPPHMKMPDGSQFYGDWKLVGDAATANPGKDYERVNLYARPAPAINLAELVPPEADGSNLPFAAEGWNACRAAILRKIEEAQ